MVDFELTTGPGDDDVGTSGHTPETADMTCTTAGGSANRAASCTVQYTELDNAGGSDAVLAWIDADGLDATVEADLAEGANQHAPGSGGCDVDSKGPGLSPEPDQTDCVEKRWIARTPAAVDVEAESASAQVGTSASVELGVYDQFGDLLTGDGSSTTVSVELLAGSAHDPGDGSDFGAPDLGSCDTGTTGRCTLAARLERPGPRLAVRLRARRVGRMLGGVRRERTRRWRRRRPARLGGRRPHATGPARAAAAEDPPPRRPDGTAAVVPPPAAQAASPRGASATAERGRKAPAHTPAEPTPPADAPATGPQPVTAAPVAGRAVDAKTRAAPGRHPRRGAEPHATPQARPDGAVRPPRAVARAPPWAVPLRPSAPDANAARACGQAGAARRRLGELSQVAMKTAERYSFPLSLAFFVFAFMVVQGRIDRRDPKLRLAPLDSKHDLATFA